jgi:hypothetical protein
MGGWLWHEQRKRTGMCVVCLIRKVLKTYFCLALSLTLNGADGRQSREHVWFGLLFQFIKLRNYADYIMKQWKETSGISGTYDDRNVNSRAKMGIMSSIWHGFSISLKKCLSSLATLPSTTTVVITLHTKTKTKGVYQSLWLLWRPPTISSVPVPHPLTVLLLNVKQHRKEGSYPSCIEHKTRVRE